MTDAAVDIGRCKIDSALGVGQGQRSTLVICNDRHIVDANSSLYSFSERLLSHEG